MIEDSVSTPDFKRISVKPTQSGSAQCLPDIERELVK